MRNAVLRFARRLLKPAVYYASNPSELFESEHVADAQGLRFWCLHQNLIERRISESGVWEPGETELVKQFTKVGHVCFDVGANIGYFTLLMSSLVGAEGHIHAFEPTRYGYERMERNLALNPHLPRNITTNRLGLLAEPVVRREALESRFSAAVASHSEKETLSFTTIDAYVHEHGLSRLDFVKIDVDGYDMQVIGGGRETLQRFRPSLLIELCQRVLVPLGGDVDAYLELLIELGYSRALVAHTGELTSLRALRGNRHAHESSLNVLLTPA